MTARFNFDNSYVRLPDSFYARILPSPVAQPQLVKLNHPLALELGLDPLWLDSPEGAEILSGNRQAEGAEPIATAYAGHQFGSFVPQLGDGRAILLGEIVDGSGLRRDIQLKGAGRTPFSRGGDGRAAVGPVIREYLVSEAMHALGVPTTRALAIVTTGEPVIRQRVLPGAVLTRVASSHIRVGTFQFFAARRDVEALRRLADHVIARHYPEPADAPDRYRALLAGVVERQARLVAQWLMVGFIHGVMNTDNMSVAGETIDYGPCAFMEAYDPATVFSSIDEFGRYAFANQPGIARWNLTRLAESLLPLLDDDQDKAVEIAKETLEGFIAAFNRAYLEGLKAKVGLTGRRDGDADLVQDLLDRMAENKADYTLTFRRLADAAADPAADASVGALFEDPAAFDVWAERWRSRLAEESGDPAERRSAMRKVNPAIIPRNHRVEQVIEAAVEDDDFTAFESMLTALGKPYEDPADPSYADPPPTRERYVTYCGT